MPLRMRLQMALGLNAVRLALAALSIALMGAAAAAAVVGHEPNAGVLKVRLGGDQNQTRVVIELDHAASGKLVSPDGPGKLAVVALPKVEVTGGEMNGPGSGIVKGWSIEQASGAARIKLDLTRAASIKRRFLLPPGDGLQVYRYVIDLEATGPVSASGAPAVQPISLPASMLPADPAAKKIIVIDAGHGGKDPGARGSGHWEKDFTLAATHALRDRLLKSGRYKVVLTRDTDVFIPLQQRVQIARRANADLFISLHADSEKDPSIRGATVYTLSEKGADRVQRGVFDRSNWFMNVALPGQDAATKRILLDLTQRETTNRSAVFAETVLSKISDKVELLRRSHRDAGFMVLLAPEVPAILLEMGFVTNGEDERVLADPERRKVFMGGVADAIDAYFTREPARVATR